MPVYVCAHGRAASAALFHPGPFLVHDARARGWVCWQSPRPSLDAPEPPEESALWEELAALHGGLTCAALAVLRARAECDQPGQLAALLGDVGG